MSCSQRDELEGQEWGAGGEGEHQERVQEEALILPQKKGIRNHLTLLQLQDCPQPVTSQEQKFIYSNLAPGTVSLEREKSESSE